MSLNYKFLLYKLTGDFDSVNVGSRLFTLLFKNELLDNFRDEVRHLFAQEMHRIVKLLLLFIFK